MLNADQSWEYSVGTDRNGSHPSCCHFGWSRLADSRLNFAYVSCLIILHFPPWECWVRQQNILTQPRYWSAKSDLGIGGVWPQPEKTDSWFKWSETIVSSRLLLCVRVGMIHRFRRKLSFRSIVNRLLSADYRSRHPVRCPRFNLDHKRHSRVCKRTQRRWDFLCLIVSRRARVRCRQGKRLIHACIQPTDGNSVMLWGAIHHGGMSELVVLDGTFNHQSCIKGFWTN